MPTTRHLLIHATNVRGLGATQVVGNLLREFAECAPGFASVTFALPATGPLADLSPDGPNTKVTRIHRKLPNALSRAFEILRPQAFLSGRYDAAIILGDVALAWDVPQVVFVHQPHLIPPSIDPLSYRGPTYRGMRQLARATFPRTHAVIVQTPAMQDRLARAYPVVGDRIRVVPQPPPFAIAPRPAPLAIGSRGLRLFYPAAPYPHKNHRLLAEFFTLPNAGELIESLTLTIEPGDLPALRNHPRVRFVGRLSPDGCAAAYAEADALVFPSRNESYGLPLVEAMAANLPILAADLPYTEALCDDTAITFDPARVDSLAAAIERLRDRLREGWQPDYTIPLAKIPRTWREVAQRFLEALP